MALPDVLGMGLDAAVKQLQSDGWRVNIKYTNSPFPAVRGVARVVRLDTVKDDTVFLTAVYELGREGGVDDSIRNYR
ncbi:hypothetical protein JOC37_000797 [Desulfohalotomaculum tongense]|uniref:PASTA domain-containing protein n=1 Tax=Desulforadius tongensis TaxID=1216062 RepID=UPI00195BAFE4|nr:PASTA domain-containing protein [Desulforadius tongensis]MBM7854424.1 hypothetical protein [Desulforadius tongensis]